MNELEQGNELYSLLEIISKAKVNVVANYLLIGETLRILKEGLWEQMGSHIAHFDAFLREIRIGRSTAYNCMAIAEHYGEYIKSNKLDADYTRLVALLPLTTEDNKEEWLAKASTLTSDDFDDEIRGAKGKTIRGECSHNETSPWTKCVSCGKFLKQ